MKQRQFLDVVDDGVAQERIGRVFASLSPSVDEVPLGEALGRVLFDDLRAAIDVPGFDRADMDGFAVQAADTFGAQELEPRRLEVLPYAIAAGAHDLPEGLTLQAGQALPIATGGQLPRGADAVLMVEDTAGVEGEEGRIDVFRPVAPGTNLTGAGTDVGRGEIILRARQLLGSRETALAAAVGAATLPCFKRPRVGVISTGDELKPPGESLAVGQIYDSNGRILADAVTEAGAEAFSFGIVADDEAKLREVLEESLTSCDVVLMSGGTSKGAGDLNHRVIKSLSEEVEGSAGIVVHGVALKPGKPICVAGIGGTPAVVLPGFPTSAIFTFHEFIAPRLRKLAGQSEARRDFVAARAPMRLPSAKGRTEYMLVDLVEGAEGPSAYPLGRGSGSVSTFSAADGFIRIDRHTEFVEAGARLQVRPLGQAVRHPDLVAIGSHCLGLDYLLGQLAREGFAVKAIAVGSQGGLRALDRGEGDVAGTHLLDAETGRYNRAFLPEGCEILGGWGRRQGLVFRADDARFVDRDLDRLAEVVHAAGVVMVNRNRGSGTRVLLDEFLQRQGEPGAWPAGYHAQAKSHHAVAAAVAQGRADWGMTLDALAEAQGLSFVFVKEETFELAFTPAKGSRPAIEALRRLLEAPETQAAFEASGLLPPFAV